MNALPPPPRRSAPPQLEQRIRTELAAVPDRRFRPRVVVLPLVAASLAGALALGVPPVVERLDRRPQIAASPTPAPTPVDPGPTSSPALAAPPELTLRAMTKAEIARDLASCQSRTSDPNPTAGKRVVLWAQVQRPAGVSRPVRERIRVLVTQDDVGRLTCRNGSPDTWSSETSKVDTPSRASAVAVDTGSLSSACGSDVENWRTGGDALYRVGGGVAYARIRLLSGSVPGPWQIVRPRGGWVMFSFAAVGREAKGGTFTVQMQFVDDEGQRVAIKTTESGGTKPVTTDRTTWKDACEELPRARKKPVTRPTSDRAGVRRCLELGRGAAGDGAFGSGWKSVLTVSTDQEWGAVLSNGTKRFGCSLFPTAEISALVPDRPSTAEKAFHVALNPIGETEGQSLWAAGRVPAGTDPPLYVLPDGVFQRAEPGKNGYWMLMAHRDAPFGGSDDWSDWVPMRVSLIRDDKGYRSYTIGYSEATVCNQISHGC